MTDGRPSTGTEIVQVVEVFRRLASDMWARSAWPAPDGSVVFTYPGKTRDARLYWRPWSKPAETPAQPWGSAGSQGLTPAEEARLLARLAQVAGDRAVGGLDPLARGSVSTEFPDEDDPIIALSRPALAQRLAPWLQARRTRFGAFLLEDIREGGEDGITLRFSSPAAAVVFHISPASTPLDAGTGPSTVVGPLRVSLTEGSGPSGPGRALADRLVNYVLYALTRAVHGATGVEVERTPPPAPLNPVESPVADDEEPWEWDPYDERAEDTFLAEPSLRFLSDHHIFSTVAACDEGVVIIGVLGEECKTHFRGIRSTRHLRHLHPRVKQIPFFFPDERIRWIESDEMSLITGFEEGLAAELRAVRDDDRVRLVIVIDTCFSQVVGTDTEGILERELEGTDKTGLVVVDYIGEKPLDGLLWRALLPPVTPASVSRAGRVNLVGFDTRESPFTRELEGILSALGGGLNAMIIPSFETKDADHFHEAECTVVSTAELAGREFRLAREQLSGTRFVDLDPPFGPGASSRFYLGLAEAAGLDAASAPWDEVWARLQPDWDRQRRHAMELEIALIVSPENAMNLLEPESFFGLDVVRVLLEMGFSVRIVVTAGSRPSEVSATRDQLVARFAVGGTAPTSRPTIETAPAALPVAALLAGIPSALVLTEFGPDFRILEAGKGAISAKDFQLGFHGAVSTITRLVRIGRNRVSLEGPCD